MHSFRSTPYPRLRLLAGMNATAAAPSLPADGEGCSSGDDLAYKKPPRQLIPLRDRCPGGRPHRRVNAYLDREVANPAADSVSYRQGTLRLTQGELADLNNELL